MPGYRRGARINEKSEVIACYKNCYGGKTEKEGREWERRPAILNSMFGK